MFNALLSPEFNALLERRLQNLESYARSLKLTTREEYLAALTSEVNRVLNQGNAVAGLFPVPNQGPAKAGDVTDNLVRLNDDGSAIVAGMLELERDAARLFNLYAGSQNSLRQQIRERIHQSGRKKYQEEFISDAGLQPSLAYFDFNAGAAALPLLKDTVIAPSSFRIGVSSDANGKALSPLDYLADSLEETAFTFEGGRLELVVEFTKPEILNYLHLQLDEYFGLNVVSISASPDGIVYDDLLADGISSSFSAGGASGKYSGDYVLLFDPRHVKQVKLVLEDRVGKRRISIRSLTFGSRRYKSSGVLTTKMITEPVGLIQFSSELHNADQLTAVTHQFSRDGVHFQSLNDGDVIDVSTGPYWYRAFLERMEGNFETLSQPLTAPGEDPAISSDYKISRIQTTELGSGIVERTLDFETVTGPIIFRETPNPGTVVCYEGVSTISPAEFQMNFRTLSFAGPRTGITVRYQTSAYTRSGLVARRDYYTPYLYRIWFEKV